VASRKLTATASANSTEETLRSTLVKERESREWLGRWLVFPRGGIRAGWPLEQFALLADYLIRNDGADRIVFAGPEERQLSSQIKHCFALHNSL